MHNSIIAEIFQDFASLIYPNYCLSCNGPLVKGENLVCTPCMLEMPQTKHHLDQNNSLKARLSGRIAVEHVMALFKFSKSGRVQRLLHSLKYKNHPEIGIMLGNLYGERLIDANLQKAFELIIPVPLHNSRRRSRGYNQSAKFAEGLSQKLLVPFSDKLIERKIRTETQTRKTKLNRWQNVSDVFYVKNPEEIAGKRILLVDDVVTTGATLEACSHHLVASGCSTLSIACIAEA